MVSDINPSFSEATVGQKVSSREPFYTKTHLKYFKILYPPQYFIKLKLKLPVDFYFYYNFLLAVFYNNNIENYYEAIKLGKS